MSGHLIGCAGDAQDLGKSHKLALVAFADSADDRTHIAFPGYEGVMKWASCSRSRAAELINDLEAAGYLEQHRTSRPGRRAEYVVFPGGCCDVHRTPDTEPRPTVETVQAWARQAGVELTDDQAKAMAALPGNGSEISDVNGSGISDLSTPDGSEIPDLSAGNGSEISVQVQNGSEKSDPFTTTTTNPLTPSTVSAEAAIAAVAPPSPRNCPTHGSDPIRNCRGCGTTARQLEAAEREAAIARKRAADRAAAAAERASRAAAARASQTPETRAVVEATRKRIHDAQAATKAARNARSPKATSGSR